MNFLNDIVSTLKLGESATPLMYIIAGLVLGLIFEKILLIRLQKTAAKSRFKNLDFLISPLRGITLFLFLIAGLYGALLNLSLDHATVERTEKFFIVLIIIAVTYLIADIATGFMDFHARRAGKLMRATSIINNVTRMIIFIVGLLMILNTLGIAITPILTALGVGGLAVALALQPTLSNLFAGLQLILSKQVSQGDYVRLNSGEEGYIMDITWRNTSIRTLSHNVIIIPNSALASALVTNYSHPETEISVTIPVTVHYENDLEKVEKVTLEVAREVLKEVPGALAQFEPYLLFQNMAEPTIRFNVIMHAHESVGHLQHAFIKKLHARYRKENIKK